MKHEKNVIDTITNQNVGMKYKYWQKRVYYFYFDKKYNKILF